MMAAVLDYVHAIEKNPPVFRKTLRIHFLRNFTIEPIEPFLKYHCYQAGIQPLISYSDYGNLAQAVLDSNSSLMQDEPDLIVLALYGDVFEGLTMAASESHGEVMVLLNLLEAKTTATVMVNTQLPVLWTQLVSNAKPVDSLNRQVVDFVQEHPRFVLCPWDCYLQRVGEAEGLDARYWYLNKAPFKKAFLDVYAKDMARVASVLSGKLNKCLILDCDNTLWGGIVGEEGCDGIKLDANGYPGKLFYDFQKSVVYLQNRGVMIALCSKNNPEAVFEILDTHPHSLLKRHHLVGHRINWEDKATNLKSLIRELNIGADSVVFVDDSGIECELVKQFLPEVTVLQVPKDLTQLPTLLLRANLFDTLSLTEQDRQRTVNYQQEQDRKQLAETSVDLDAYLAGLDLVVDIHDCRSSEVARVAQLSQKTNQFNLSLHRYSEGEIANFVAADGINVFVLWAKDRFGDYGLTGAAILKRQGHCAVLDSLWLSCRVLSRRIEYAFITRCWDQIQVDWQVDAWDIPYTATPKNAQVEAFLKGCGCVLDREVEGSSVFVLSHRPLSPSITFIAHKEFVT